MFTEIAFSRCSLKLVFYSLPLISLIKDKTNRMAASMSKRKLYTKLDRNVLILLIEKIIDTKMF